MSSQPVSAAPESVSTRRRFLKQASGTLAAGAVGALAAGRGVHAAGKDRVRIGLIGCGERGTGAAIQALSAHPSVRLIAVADIFEDHVRRSLERVRKAKPDQVEVDRDHAFVGFDGYRHVIASDVDAILIACTSRFHPKFLRAGVDAGKHVFVEKPHAIDPPGVHEVLEACDVARRKGVCVVSGLHRRYMEPIQETIARVHDGAIGEIVAMEVSFMRAPYRVIPCDRKWSEIEWQFRTWYHFRWLSGDDVPQSLVHTLDVASWAMNGPMPAHVHGLGGRSASIAHRYGDVFDHDAVVYEYPSGARLYALTRTQVGCHGEVAVKLLGTKGRAYEGRIEGENPWRWQGKWPSGHALEQVAFMRAIREGKTINNGNYMAHSTQLGIMGQMATYTGKQLGWDEAWKSDYRYPPREGEVDFTTDPPVKAGPDGIYPVPVPGKTKLA